MKPSQSPTSHLFFIIIFLCFNTFNLLFSSSLKPDSGTVASPAGNYDNILHIGSRLELFVDDHVIDRLEGNAELRLHHPVPKEIVMVHDAPWEGSGSGYHSVFKDGDKYRMYYKAWQLTVTPETVKTDDHPLYCCYAESSDGIHWNRPNLKLYKFNGSKKNNIVFINGEMGGVNADGGHPAVFKDENPNVSPDALYKAVLRSYEPWGLYVFKSPDGIHWTPMTNTPVITDGAFDSQNLAFWDNVKGEYRAYWRYFTDGTVETPYKGIRSIRTAASKDMINWSDQQDLVYVDSPLEQLYTNVIKPYYRAPHIYIGFPTRYTEREWSESLQALPDPQHREWRSAYRERYGTALSEALFMSSRDGVLFKRRNEAFLRPGIERPGTWSYGQQYIGWSFVETRSDIPGAPDELSFYAVEDYWTGKSCSLRRYTLRIDGFVSASAPMSGGELITKPITFKGSKLVLNFSTSAAGSLQVEIQDTDGNPLPGFSLRECPAIYGDTIERKVSWENGSDLVFLEGEIIRLRFVLKDADLFSFKFE